MTEELICADVVVVANPPASRAPARCMNRIRLIRARLGVTQEVLSVGIGCTRGNIPHYERGQTVPPLVACRLISYAASLGVKLTYDQIYGDAELPPPRLLPRRVEVKA